MKCVKPLFKNTFIYDIVSPQVGDDVWHRIAENTLMSKRTIPDLDRVIKNAVLIESWNRK